MPMPDSLRPASVFSHGRGWSFLGFFSALAMVGLLAPSYELLAVNQHLLLCLNVLALNFCLGLGGQVCMAQGAFCGMGAYLTVMLHQYYPGGSVWILPAAALCTAAVGAAVSRPLEQLHSGFLAMATVGVHSIFINVVLAFPRVTGGAEGMLSAVPLTLPGGITLSGDLFYFAAFSGLLLLASYVYAALETSRPGRALLACREDPLAAASCGINRPAIRAQAFAIGAALSCLAGSLYAHYSGFISPRQFDLGLSLKTLLYLVIGGQGRLFSPLVAVVVLETLLSRLEFLGDARSLVQGLLLAGALLIGPALRGRSPGELLGRLLRKSSPPLA
ncbi:branched-chain amino acid ABC transporter permease [Megalodesulfovibrio gigas]|nr:branched-chain amino acid ABC transporter permease [Megalodesulfovibrio gigas]